MKKIFVTREIPEAGLGMLRDRGYEVTVWPKDRAPKPKELLKALGKAPYDAVISLLTDRIGAKEFDAVPTARIFANYAAGYNNIDIEEAKRRGIAVTNTPNVSGKAVAEHTVALIFALTTRLVEGDRFMRAGRYKGWDPSLLVGTDLAGKTVGLIGAGNIGSEVARMLYSSFSVRVLYYDIAEHKDLEEKYGAVRIQTVEEVLRESDVVSLHVPLLDSTRHLIDASRLALMKPSAFLVNTSRGPVVDEKALVDALKARKIRGAALDVFEFEPELAPGLAKLDNVVLTPHIASSRESVRDDMARIAAQNVIDFLEGGAPKNKVN